MSRIEELPDDFDEKLLLKDDQAARPSLPPDVEAMRGQSANDIVKMLGRSPLFMTSLDDIDEEGTSIRLLISTLTNPS